VLDVGPFPGCIQQERQYESKRDLHILQIYSYTKIKFCRNIWILIKTIVRNSDLTTSLHISLVIQISTWFLHFFLEANRSQIPHDVAQHSGSSEYSLYSNINTASQQWWTIDHQSQPCLYYFCATCFGFSGKIFFCGGGIHVTRIKW